MFWVKHLTSPTGKYEVAQGPFATEAQAQAVIDARSEANDPGTIVENDDPSYPHTLKHPIGRQADSTGQDYIVYSDGSKTPIE